MEKTIRDIGRPRIRSSRPTPPSEPEGEWLERMAPDDLGGEDEKASEMPHEEKETRH